MVDDNDEFYEIADWIAPWVDRGERMLAYIDGVREVAEADNEGDHDVVWQLGMLMMARQIESDIHLASIARSMGLNTSADDYES